jgi:hypothetical protein
MTRKLYSPLLVAVASAALVAGCGSSKSPASTTPKKTAPAKTTPASTKPASTTPAATTPAAGAPSGAELQAAGAECKTALSSIPATFGATAKSDLSSVCSDLSNGNLAAARSDAQKYCYAILAAVPAADKVVAQTECKAIGKSF